MANQSFEEMGYEVRIKGHEGYELDADNDNQHEGDETPSVAASDVDHYRTLKLHQRTPTRAKKIWRY